MRLQKREATGTERETLAREPEQDGAMSLCLTAWKDLSTVRSLGFSGAGHIPWDVTKAWAEDQGLDRMSRAVLWAVLCRLERDRFEREQSTRDLNNEE